MMTVALPAAAAPLRAADVAAVADAEGERAAIARHFDCGSSGNAAYARVASGAADWLALAVRLLKESDGCVTTLLVDSIARALIPAPHRVLLLVGSSELLAPARICVPFLSVDEDPRNHLAYLSRLESVLVRVSAPELQPAKQACLREVREARKWFKMGARLQDHSLSSVSSRRAGFALARMDGRDIDAFASIRPPRSQPPPRPPPEPPHAQARHRPQGR